MWSAGKPPPTPTPTPTVESQGKNYRMECQQTELDHLRQRGLAKLLNKHFTNVTHTLAEERAAADAALQDLEARKAAGLKDWGNSAGELSVWDKLYLELQQKKAECKRKERETLLLYQRYVDKFGNTGVVTVPTKPPSRVADESLPPRSSIPSTTPTKVPHMAGQIESTLANLTGAERYPSIKFLGKDVTQQQAYASMDQQERINFMRSLEGRHIDARSTPSTPSPQTSSTMFSSKEGIPESPQLTTDFPWTVDTATKLDGTATTVSSPDAILDVDMQSIMSGLTTSGEFSDAERILIDFLRTETEAIRRLLDDEEEMTVCSMKSSLSSELLSQTAAAAEEAEDLVKKMEQMLLDFTSETKADDAHEPRKLETSNPDEEWMVYWDDMAQRHYYYELRTHKAQWAKPSGVLTGSCSKSSDDVPLVDYTRTSSDRSSGELEYLELTHRDHVPRTSRREQYRKMRRRHRKRRLVVFFLLGMSAVGAVLYMNLHHHQETKEMLARVLGGTEQAEIVIDTIEAYLPDSVTGRSERNEKRIKEENERIRQENAEKAKLAAAELKAKEEQALQEKLAKEQALQEKLAKEEEEKEAVNVKNIGSTFNQSSSLLCYNPHYFMVNNKRGLC